MRVVLAFVALITLGLVAACGGELPPTPTPTPTTQETYLKSVQRWAFLLQNTLSERELYEEAAIDPLAVLEAATIDPSTTSRPIWMANFDVMIGSLDFLYLDPASTFAFKGKPVSKVEVRADGIKQNLRTMIREYELWKADPYGNADALERLADVHVYAFRAVSQLNLDAIKAMNTGDY